MWWFVPKTSVIFFQDEKRGFWKMFLTEDLPVLLQVADGVVSESGLYSVSWLYSACVFSYACMRVCVHASLVCVCGWVKPKTHLLFISNEWATFTDTALWDLGNHISWDKAWTFGGLGSGFRPLGPMWFSWINKGWIRDYFFLITFILKCALAVMWESLCF